MIHTVKGFSIVNELEVDVSLEFPCFFYDPADVGDLISGSFVFSKSSLYTWKFSVHILLKPSLKDFEHYFTSVWNEHNCTVVWRFFGIAFPWDWNENWPFPDMWLLMISKFSGILSAATPSFTASSIRIWNSCCWPVEFISHPGANGTLAFSLLLVTLGPANLLLVPPLHLELGVLVTHLLPPPSLLWSLWSHFPVHQGLFRQPWPDSLECEVKWTLGSMTVNKLVEVMMMCF